MRHLLDPKTGFEKSLREILEEGLGGDRRKSGDDGETPSLSSRGAQRRGIPTPRNERKRRKLAQGALEIEGEEARAAGALGFMARILVQATLPHSRPQASDSSHEFERVNGRFTLWMSAPPSVGLPYGSYPRLALAWLSTEAVRTRSREIELGPTFSSFMYKLGLTPITGKRGTTSRLREQLHRLFSTTIRCSYSDETEGHAAGVGYTIAHKHRLWWSPRDPEQRPLWSSGVVLSTEFYEELVAHAVPIDLRALKALRGSPLALDIYSWLTYRMSYLRRPCLIPWEALQTQFGADYGRIRDFKRKFLSHLADVLHVYPAARLSEQPTGLLLQSSPTHLPRSSPSRR